MPEYLQHNDEGSAVVGLLHNLLTEASLHQVACTAMLQPYQQ